jgi:exopolysaccharide production protein ExoZ
VKSHPAQVLNVLQAGRAIAATSVAAFHLSISMGTERYGGEAVFRDFTRDGASGVDFFFILSGFIILFAHVGDIGKPHRWGEYVYRRFVRLYPIYWLYTAGFCFLLLLGFGTYATMPNELLSWITSLTLIRFNDGTPPIGPAWTLFHEVAFYSMFSLLILNKRLGIAALAAWAVLCAAFYHFPSPDERTPFNVYSAALNLYFLFGMGAYWLFRQPGRGLIELIPGLIIATLAIALPWPESVRPMILVTGLALLTAGAAKLERNGDIKVPYFLTYIGNASYTIYLAHLSLEGLLLKIAMKTSLYELAGAKVVYVLVLAGTIALGCLAYALVEKPLLEGMRRYRKRRSQADAGTVAAHQAKALRPHT